VLLLPLKVVGLQRSRVLPVADVGGAASAKVQAGHLRQTKCTHPLAAWHPT
jgi:hypothetical protein